MTSLRPASDYQCANSSVSRVQLMVGIGTLLLLAASHDVFAQSADELAKQTQNPVASLISVPFQANWDVGIGTREAIGTTRTSSPWRRFR